MLRVLLKIDKVCIRIKETVQIHILISKGQKTICLCKRQSLINGQLTLNKSSQFFIDPAQPTFQLQVYLVKGNLKKQGGVVPLDLSHYPMNASHRKTPLSNSTIQIDFVYMRSERPVERLDLISQEQIQSISHKATIKEMTSSNKQLMQEKNRMEEEIEQLRFKFEELEEENKMVEESMSKLKQQRRGQSNSLEKERDNTYSTLESEKKKIAEIVDMINQSGNYRLISKAEKIIEGNSSHSHTSGSHDVK